MNFINEVTLQKIIDGCVDKNRQSQKQLYDIYAKQMTGLCYRYCGDYETARDLMHDGFIKIFSSVDQYRGTGSFEGWLKKIVVNIVLDYIRKNDILNETVKVDSLENLSEEEQKDDEDIFNRFSIKNITDAIAQLPEVARTIFNMYNIDGYSIEDISNKLGMTSVAVRSQHSRAKQKLREILRGMDFD
jgi:RNA polymerase sigma-70 factor (ECF subfamily)